MTATETLAADARAHRRVWIAAVVFLACLATILLLALFELPPPGRPEDEGSPFVFLGVALLFPLGVPHPVAPAAQPRRLDTSWRSGSRGSSRWRRSGPSR